VAIIEATFRDIAGDGTPATTRKVNFPSQAAQAQYLRALVKEYRNRWPIREKAINIVRQAGAAAKDKVAQALAIGQWAQREAYYVNEPEETYATPLRTLAIMGGDCDDLSTLVASLCESIGIPTHLVCVGPWPELTHIYPEAVVQTARGVRLIPLDATLSAPIGTDPMSIVRRRWPIRGHARKF
jgi:transglutaminase-like putative cysteine protease